MRVIINRIENNIAVCEIGGKTIDAPAELFENLHEGAVYDIIENNATEEIKKSNRHKSFKIFLIKEKPKSAAIKPLDRVKISRVCRFSLA